jgi:glucosamine--fructose-6-phosphate aminotransferase (isomerizing)
MSLREEIFQQPEVLENLITKRWEHISETAKRIQSNHYDYIYLTARGTSDYAGLYAKYVFGIKNHLSMALAGPSMFSLYHSGPSLNNSLVIGISQSGESPDIIQVITEGNYQDVPTLVITNSPTSTLANSAKYLLDICAGHENAVAATKSYTATLVTIALLSAALSGDEKTLEDIKQVPKYIDEMLKHESLVREVVSRYTTMTHTVVLGRGYNYASAFEWALKLKELCYVVAEPFSTADFLHGPIAIIEPKFPVFAFAPLGYVYGEVFPVLQQLATMQKAELCILSNHPDALSLANIGFKLPENMAEWISPIVNIVVSQLFCYWLTIEKGFDPENPRDLSKITKTL